MISNIISSIKEYGGALSLMFKLKLWKYFIIPMLISFFTAVFIVVLAYNLSDNIGGYIVNLWKWDFGKDTFNFISTFISGLLILVIGLMFYKHIVMALAAPFMSPVSEKIENYLTNEDHQHRNTTFKDQLIRGLRISIRNFSKEILFTIPILLLGLIPIVGLISTLLLFFMQAYYVGFGNMDYTLERHFRYKESVLFVKNNRGIAIGNGIVFMLILLIPIIGVVLVLPFSVTAATIQTVKQLNKINKINIKE